MLSAGQSVHFSETVTAVCQLSYSGLLSIMCHLQLRTLVFVAWVLGYVAFLLSIRRMWTGKYVRSPLIRSLFMDMVTDNEAAAIETQEV